MPALFWTYVFGVATAIALLAGLVVLYRRDGSLSTASTAGLAVLAFGVLVFGFMTWTTFVAGHHTYELTPCNESMLVSTTDGEPYENLSETGQRIVRETHAAGGEYRSLRKASDFKYVSDAMSAEPIEYQGQCYAMLAREAGMGFGGLLLIPPALVVGFFSTWIGLEKLRSGRFVPALLGPVLVGILVFLTLLVYFNFISSTVTILVSALAAALAAVLWWYADPIGRLRDRISAP